MSVAGGQGDQRDAALKPICTSLTDEFCILAGPAKSFPVITARSTDSAQKMCCFLWRNAHPRMSTLPEDVWIAARSPSLPHCTNVQSLNPTVPWPPIFAIWLHGPQKALLLIRTTP